MSFISSSCLMTMARTSTIMLNKSSESGHPCLVSNIKGNSCSFCPLNMLLAVGLSYMAFTMVMYVSSYPTLLRVFIINGCWNLSNTFSASIDMIMWFLFILLLWWITFTDLRILYQPCIPGINATWSWCVIFLMHWCIQVANILVRILASIFIRDIGL